MNDTKIIEIIGPPGVGKTTLYDFLCNTWNPVSNWSHYNALINKKPDILKLQNWLSYTLQRIIKRRGSKTLPVELGMRFIQEHKELAAFCWKYLYEVYKDDLDRRFRLSYFLFTDFCKYQKIIETNNEKPCFINEGLLQKSFFVDVDEINLYDHIEQYTSLLPLPYAIINMNIDDIDVILSRLTNRKKVIASHLGMTDESLKQDILKWQATLQAMVKIMSGKGVKVFNIDGEQSTKMNVSFIKKELNIH